MSLASGSRDKVRTVWVWVEPEEVVHLRVLRYKYFSACRYQRQALNKSRIGLVLPTA